MSDGESKTQSTAPAPVMTPTRTVTTPARRGREMVQDWTEDDAALDVADCKALVLLVVDCKVLVTD